MYTFTIYYAGPNLWSSSITHQLIQLFDCSNLRPNGLPWLPQQITLAESPINISFWEQELASHKDAQFVALILQGLRKGFPIGFQSSSHTLRPAKGNLISALVHPQVVSNYIAKELELQRIALVGPAATTTTISQFNIQLSPLGVIPKKGRVDQWRMIMDLSSPNGGSINDGISRDSCSCQYTSVMVAAQKVLEVGKGALLAKMDIKQAYRNISVAPEDTHLLGFQWDDKIYVDLRLPFGLRSAPFIFSSVADALLWIMMQNGLSWGIHYLDDFLTIGTSQSSECYNNAQVMQSVCEKAGLPVEPSKSQGPSTSLVFLGIEIDSVAGVLRLPTEKLQSIKNTLASWRHRKACRKRELLSLIGILAHASKVVRVSRIFLRRLIDLSMQARQLDHFIRLNADARSDLEWWFQFIVLWNGVSFLESATSAPPDITITSDASGSWGCGAIWDHRWLQLQWVGPLKDAIIAIKELVPVILALAIWGHFWSKKTIRILSDNSTVVIAINTNTSRVPDMAHLLRCAAFLQAHFQCQLTAQHIPGIHNSAADAISRNNISRFLSLYPQACPTPELIPTDLLQLLLLEKPDWCSQRWTALWSSTFHQA